MTQKDSIPSGNTDIAALPTLQRNTVKVKTL